MIKKQTLDIMLLGLGLKLVGSFCEVAPVTAAFTNLST